MTSRFGQRLLGGLAFLFLARGFHQFAGFLFVVYTSYRSFFVPWESLAFIAATTAVNLTLGSALLFSKRIWPVWAAALLASVVVVVGVGSWLFAVRPEVGKSYPTSEGYVSIIAGALLQALLAAVILRHRGLVYGEPNQSPEPTPGSVTPAARAPGAPPPSAAQL